MRLNPRTKIVLPSVFLLLVSANFSHSAYGGAITSLTSAGAGYDQKTQELLATYPKIKDNVPACGMIGGRIAPHMDKASADQENHKAKIAKALKSLSDANAALNAARGDSLENAAQEVIDRAKTAKKTLAEVLQKLSDGYKKYNDNLATTNFGLQGGNEECETGYQAYSKMGNLTKELIGKGMQMDKALTTLIQEATTKAATAKAAAAKTAPAKKESDEEIIRKNPEAAPAN